MTSATRARPARWQLPQLAAPPLRVVSVDRETMIEIDRIATDRIGLSLLQMMENAGRELADLTRQVLGGSVSDRSVVVLAGTGNNAGGGLVAARRLAGWGARACVAFAEPILRLRPGPCAQVEPMLAAGVQTAVAGHDRSYRELAAEIGQADAVIDALIGYSLNGPPSDRFERLIEIAGLGDGPVISLDLPSGVDATTGERPGAAVRADLTLALALPKLGTEIGEGRTLSGVRYLADIGIPAGVLSSAGVQPAPALSAPVVRLS